MGRMTDILLPVTFSVFDLQNHKVPQIKSQTLRQPLINLVNTTLYQNMETQL